MRNSSSPGVSLGNRKKEKEGGRKEGRRKGRKEGGRGGREEGEGGRRCSILWLSPKFLF